MGLAGAGLKLITDSGTSNESSVTESWGKSTVMRMIGILCWCVAIGLPALVLAELAITPKAFGHLQGTLDYCAQVDSRSAPKYKERAKLMVRSASEKDLEEARNSDEYKDAYDWISAELGKAPKDRAIKCTAFLEDK